MKKFLLTALLALPLTMLSADTLSFPTLMPKGHDHHKYGFFYVTNEQLIYGPNFSGPTPVYDAIEWDQNLDVHSDDIHVSHTDNEVIVLDKKGTYLVTFIISGYNSTYEGVGTPNFRFALELNGEIVDGSVYGVWYDNDNALGFAQLVGQAIFRTEKWGHLRVINDTNNGFPGNNVTLVNVPAPSNDPYSTTASIVIQRLSEKD